MTEQFTPKQETPAVELRIVEPRGDKNFMIAFECNDRDKVMAYNIAVQIVAKSADLIVFHQVGVNPSGSNDPGYHAWEFKNTVTQNVVEELLAQIHANAKIYLPAE
ncbi:TPA: hypothetical protein DF272_02115 [Candidatus Falkowbacteria bacterium]|nr:hypothetical protein [Candidatus Falkowbacteria bacterium]